MNDVCKATIWGDHVGTLNDGCCYLLSSFMIKGTKYEQGSIASLEKDGELNE